MLRILCAKAAGLFPPLPPVPWRPLIGAGAAIGPVRPAVVCVAILCASGTATAPPEASELIPPAAPPQAWRADLDASRAPVPIPAPGGALLFLAGLAGLAWLRRF